MDDKREAIVRDLYAAALDERPWREVVEQAAALLDATSVFLFTPFVAECDGGLSVFHGFPEHEAIKFLGEVATVDLWYLELLRRHGSLRTALQWQSDAPMPEAALRRTRFFNDHLAPCGIGLGPCAAQPSSGSMAGRTSTSIVRSLALMGGENSTTTTGDYWKTTDNDPAKALRASAFDKTPHDRAVLRLDPRLVVLPIRPRSGELHPSGCTARPGRLPPSRPAPTGRRRCEGPGRHGEHRAERPARAARSEPARQAWPAMRASCET